MPQYANFQVDPRLATLLGEYYRSSEAALKELVDNAWDADAACVDITLPKPLTGDPIILSDDGSGMTPQEVTSEYLVVASDRRTRKGDITHGKKWKVKGRKGIGKFAGLMAADVMKVQTRARGKETALMISRQDLIGAKRDLEKFDIPVDTVSCDADDHPFGQEWQLEAATTPKAQATKTVTSPASVGSWPSIQGATRRRQCLSLRRGVSQGYVVNNQVRHVDADGRNKFRARLLGENYRDVAHRKR